MQVSTDIHRSDLIRFNLFLLPRAKANLIFVAALAVGFFFYALIKKQPDNIGSIATVAIASLLGGIGGLLGGFVVSLVFVLLSSNEKNGVLGKHTYLVTPEGLHESTSSNEGLQKWAGVQAVEKSPSFIFIRINGYLFHLIPRRAFDTQQEFESFWINARKFWESAAQQKVQGPTSPPSAGTRP